MNESRINLLKKYILEEPVNPFNRYALAMEYYNQEPAIALTLLEDLLTEHPDYLPAYYKAAHLYWEQNLRDFAERTFLAGIRLAEDRKDEKTLKELKSAHLNFRFEVD